MHANINIKKSNLKRLLILLSFIATILFMKFGNMKDTNFVKPQVVYGATCQNISAAVTAVTRVNPTAQCNAPTVTVVSPTRIEARFENYPQGSPALCRNMYPITYTEGVGWQLTACYTGTCETRTLMTTYEGTFTTGGLEDTDESTGDGQPDYSISVSAAGIGCCDSFTETLITDTSYPGSGFTQVAGDPAGTYRLEPCPVDTEYTWSAPEVEANQKVVGMRLNMHDNDGNWWYKTGSVSPDYPFTMTGSPAYPDGYYDVLTVDGGPAVHDIRDASCQSSSNCAFDKSFQSMTFYFILKNEYCQYSANDLRLNSRQWIVMTCNTACGNHTIDEGEECDDGNNVSNDGCSDTCQDEFCGDGIRQTTEQCDEGVEFDDDSTCSDSEGCTDRAYDSTGDGSCVMDSTKVSASCKSNICGDGYLTMDEMSAGRCDLGVANGAGKGCDVNCYVENAPWFDTRFGEVYSSKGVDQTMMVNEKLSSYTCLKNGGSFDLGGGGCTLQSGGDSFWSIEFGSDNLETAVSGEFTEIKNKLDERFASGDEFVFGTSPVIYGYKNKGLDEIGLVDNTYVDRNIVLYMTSNLTIDRNLWYSPSCTTEKDCSLLIFVDGDVEISAAVEHIDAFIVAMSKAVVLTQDNDLPITITGGVVALGNDLTGNDPAIELNRNIIFYGAESGNPNNNTSPSEYVEYDPRYVDIYRSSFGEIGDVTFNESGIE